MQIFFYFLKNSKDDDKILCVLSDMINSYFFNYTSFFKNVKIIHKIFISDEYDIIENINLIYLDILYLYQNIPLFKSNIDDLILCISDISKKTTFLNNLKLQILFWSKKYNYNIKNIDDNIIKNDDMISLNYIKSQLKYKKISIPKALKINVWNKYIGEDIGKSKCLVCETNFITQSNFECAHIQAESNDGKTNIDNLIPSCSLCNKSMKNMNLIEFKKKYFK